MFLPAEIEEPSRRIPYRFRQDTRGLEGVEKSGGYVCSTSVFVLVFILYVGL